MSSKPLYPNVSHHFDGSPESLLPPPTHFGRVFPILGLTGDTFPGILNIVNRRFTI